MSVEHHGADREQFCGEREHEGQPPDEALCSRLHHVHGSHAPAQATAGHRLCQGELCVRVCVFPPWNQNRCVCVSLLFCHQGTNYLFVNVYVCVLG